jgi:predicted amidophosphoribosyltransferase
MPRRVPESDPGEMFGLGEAFLPLSCGGCGRPERSGWCRACDRALAAATRSVRRALVAGEGADFPPVFAAAAYDGVLRAAVLAYKERGRRDLAPVLGVPLGVVVRHAAASAGTGVLLVPVPASGAAVRRRGFDHVRLVLTASAGLPPPSDVLRWTRRARDQGELGAAQRISNVTGALRVRLPRRPERATAAGPAPVVVLVDDVVTTGSTLREAVRACRSGGFVVAAAVALAATRSSRVSGSAHLRQPTARMGRTWLWSEGERSDDGQAGISMTSMKRFP